MQDDWLKKLTILQAIIIAWLVISQFVFWRVEGNTTISPRLVLSTLNLCLLGLPIYLLPRFSSPQAIWSILTVEVFLTGMALLSGIISGYLLLILVTLSKAGLLLNRQQWLSFAAGTTLVYFCLSSQNSQLLIQSSTSFASNATIASSIVGRDLPTLLAGAALVIGLVWSIRAERQHRLELEQLAARLSELSTELERKRILTQIDTSLDTTLDQIDRELAQVEQNTSANPGRTLSDARELAGNALTSIRHALKLLRNVESESQ